jgi:hypothetical protein
MDRVRLLLPVTLLLTLWLAACGVLEVGFESTAAPPPTATATTAVSQPGATATHAAAATPLPGETPAAMETPLAPATAEPPTFDRVNVYLIALDDDGRSGKRIGCGDSAVAVERSIAPTAAPLRAALDELLALDDFFYGESGLYNALAHFDVEVSRIELENGKATVHLTGEYLLIGTCEDPRFLAQLEETVLQFPTIDAVEIFINGENLKEIISMADPAETGGLQVAFVKDGNVWLWQERGETAVLTQDDGVEEVNLSHDARKVAFVRGGSLWVVNRDGSNERRLVGDDYLAGLSEDGGAAALYQFDWTPGAYTITFNTRRELEGPGLLLNDDLHRVDAITGEVTLLLAPGEGGQFTYSPGGEQIAVVTPGDISLVDAGGGNRRQVLTYTPVVTYSEYQYYARPWWAPDGRELLVVIPPADPLAQPLPATSIFRLFSDGRPAHLVNTVEAMALFNPPAISPDLALVAYLQPVGENESNLMIGLLEGGEAVLYARNAQAFDGWSPDSEQFIYTAADGTKQLGRSGMAPRPLPGSPTAVVDVRWVDGERFLFLNQTPRGWDLVLAHVDGTSEIVAAVAGFPPSYDF